MTGRSLVVDLRRVRADLERIALGSEGATDDLPDLDLRANLLRVLGAAPVARADLPALVRLSTRAVRHRITTARARGWVVETESGLGLTASGSRAVDGFRSTERRAEAIWHDAVPSGVRGKLRGALESAVARLPLEHPHRPAGYGPSDTRITGGPGHDWRPVPRLSSGRLDELPLGALLSQAEVAIAIEYERLAPIALSTTLDVVVGIPDGGRRVGSARRTELSALERHGFVVIEGRGARSVIRLTKSGAEARDLADARIADAESAVADQVGSARMESLRVALAATDDVRPTDGRGRG